MNGRLNLTPRQEWQPSTRDRTPETREHRCAQCYSYLGKSAIRCPNEPAAPILDEIRPRVTLNELSDNLDPKENEQ